MKPMSRPFHFGHSLGLHRLAIMAMVVWLSACANPALNKADQQRRAGQAEQALSTLQAAWEKEPEDVQLKAAYVKQRDSTVAHLLAQMQSAAVTPDSLAYADWLQRLEAAAPNDPRVQGLRQDIQRRQREQQLVGDVRQAIDKKQWGLAETTARALLASNPQQAQARQFMAQIEQAQAWQTRQQSSFQLAASSKQITLEFREASLRTVFESLARAANVNFVFDKDVRGDAKVTLFLRNTTVDEALRVITNTQQLGIRMLNDNTVLVFPNTNQKQRDLLDTVARSFYLVNADPKQVQTLVRTMTKAKDIYVDERLNMLVVRDTPEVIRLVEKLIASVDLPDPEVMLELEVMEVSSKRLLELGLTLPTSASYGLLDGAGALSKALLTSTEGLRWSAANPAAIATLRGTTDASNLLANPKIRARNREKAKIVLGEKLPVFSSTTTTGAATSTTVAISYIDVGLKLDLEPQIQLNDEVIIKVNLDVTNITSRVTTTNGDLAYQVGTRQATTSLRLKDGETQVLAGLINDDESKSSAGLPWLHELPGLGRLFGKQTDTHNKTEVVLLITPRIIRNLSQENLSLDAMASGTDSQPGAAPFVISQGQVKNNIGLGGDFSNSLSAPTGLARGAAAPGSLSITGPETAMQGAMVGFTVYNPEARLLSTSVRYDTSVFEDPPGASGGRLDFKVGPKGRVVKTLRIKKDAPVAATELALDDAEPWSMTVVAAPEAPVKAEASAPAESAITPVDTQADAAPQDK